MSLEFIRRLIGALAGSSLKLWNESAELRHTLEASTITGLRTVPRATTRRGLILTSTDHETIVRRLFEEAASRGDMSVIDEGFAPFPINGVSLVSAPFNRDEVKQFLRETRAMLPDLTVTVERVFSSGDLTAAAERWRCTHPISQEPVVGTILHQFRFENDRVAEVWSVGWEWLREIENAVRDAGV